MAKYLNTKVKVVVNNVDLSNWAFSVDTPDEREEVDVSGFSATGTREFLPGTRDASIEIGFLQDFASGRVHQTLEPLYTGGSVFPIYVQPDMTAGTSSANPLYRGSASLYSYDGLSGSLNDRGEITATFRPASGSSFSWGTTAP